MNESSHSSLQGMVLIFHGMVTKDAAACYYLWKGYKDLDFIYDSPMLQWSIIILLFLFTN